MFVYDIAIIARCQRRIAASSKASSPNQLVLVPAILVLAPIDLETTPCQQSELVENDALPRQLLQCALHSLQLRQVYEQHDDDDTEGPSSTTPE